MHFSLIRQAFAALLVAVLVSACGGGSSAAPPKGGITVVPGDSKATVTWVMEPGVQYWLFFAPTSTKFPSISTSDWSNIPGAQAVINVSSPYVVTGLANGFTYAFTVNARTGDGPGGPGTPSVAALPRPAGDVWVPGGASGANDLKALTYGVGADSLGTYLALGANGSVFKSTTGLSWTSVPPATTANINDSVYTFARFVAVGAAGGISYTSDLDTWTAAASGTSETLNAVDTNGTLAVAVGDKGTIRTSSDGITWSAATTVPTTQNLYGVTYSGNGFWLAVGAGGTALRSTDGSTWTVATTGTTANLRAATVLVVNSYTFVAVGDAGAVITSTDNGATWVVQNSGLTGNLRAVGPSTNRLVAVGAGGLVATSPDGVTWTQRVSGTTADLNAVLGGLSQYIVVGNGGTNINSQ